MELEKHKSFLPIERIVGGSEDYSERLMLIYGTPYEYIDLLLEQKRVSAKPLCYATNVLASPSDWFGNAADPSKDIALDYPVDGNFIPETDERRNYLRSRA